MRMFEGDVGRDDDHFTDYANAASIQLRCREMWPQQMWSEETLVSFDAPDILVGSHYVPIDTHRQRMMLNQTYDQAIDFLPQRHGIRSGRYSFISDPERVSDWMLLLGGPLDGVWYHWLFSWAPRLLLLERLRPGLLADERLKILVHPLALQQPFLSILEAFPIATERFVALDPAKEHLLEQATIVSFLNQNRLYPDLVAEMDQRLRGAMKIRRRPANRRIFASRQPLPAPKRRIANADVILPLLEARGFAIHRLGEMHAAEQIQAFHDADIVVGAHGSDLANLMFCRPGTDVLVIENAFSIAATFHIGLKELCAVSGLTYHLFEAATVPPLDTLTSPLAKINADYAVDAERLTAALDAIVAARQAKVRTAAGRHRAASVPTLVVA